MLVFIALGLLNGLTGGEDNSTSLKHYPALEKFISLNHWQTIFNPDHGREIEAYTLSEGTGDYAACGQRATLSVRTLEETPSLPDRFFLPAQPLHFTIGDGSVHPVWDRGVRGMHQGEIRQILAGPRLIHPDMSVPEGPPYPFELELLALEPYLADPDLFRQQHQRSGRGTPAVCGDMIALHAKLLDNQGLFSAETDSPLIIRLGLSQLGHGVDRGAIGLRVNGTRRIHIPPAYLPAVTTTLPFPKDKTAIVELTRIAYNPPTTTEEPYGPDRQAPERD